MEKARHGPLTRQLQYNLRQLRQSRGLSLGEVSARVQAAGRPLSLNGVSKIELGQRGVDLDDVAALAHALRVSPLELMFPLGRETMVEVLPGWHMGTWAAAKWFTGEGPLLRRMPDGAWAADNVEESRDGVEAAVPLFFRDQDALFDEWNRRRRRVLALARQSDADDEEVEFARNAVERVENDLRRHRAHVRRAGVDPGLLNEQLAHIEEG